MRFAFGLLALGACCALSLPLALAQGAPPRRAPPSTTPAPGTPVRFGSAWRFEVHVLTGSRAGQTHRGSFTIASTDPARIQGTAVAEGFRFVYAGRAIPASELSGPVRVRMEDGRPRELFVVGGPQHLRFGFSEGFQREQFNRPEEAWIARGEPYFGYLDPATFVDGAGVVEFQPAAP